MEMKKMKRKIIGGLIAIVVVALVVAFSGCIEKTPEPVLPETPSEIPTKSGGTAIDVMKQVPKGGSLLYVDCKKLREDPDLAPIWNQWKSNSFMTESLKDLPIPESDVPLNRLNYWALNKYRAFTYVIGGDFDLEKIRDDLQHRGWEKGTYRKVEVWHGENGDINEIALFEDKITAGGVEAVETAIRVMKGEEESLHDEDDIIDIANKLSDGFIVTIRLRDELSLATLMLYEVDWPQGDVKGWGSSFEKISKEDMKQQGIIKLTDESKAKDFVSSAQQKMKGWTGLEVTIQEEYVIGTAIYKIGEWG
jgi:hypothetical protein